MYMQPHTYTHTHQYIQMHTLIRTDSVIPVYA